VVRGVVNTLTFGRSLAAGGGVREERRSERRSERRGDLMREEERGDLREESTGDLMERGERKERILYLSIKV